MEFFRDYCLGGSNVATRILLRGKMCQSQRKRHEVEWYSLELRPVQAEKGKKKKKKKKSPKVNRKECQHLDFGGWDPFWISDLLNSKMGFPVCAKDLPANAGDSWDMGSIPGLGRSSRGGHGNPLQYSCLENPWTEEPGGLQSRSQRVRRDWRFLAHMHNLFENQIFNITDGGKSS